MKKEFLVTMVCDEDGDSVEDAAYNFWAEWISPEVAEVWVEIQEVDFFTGVKKGPVFDVSIDGNGRAETRERKK